MPNTNGSTPEAILAAARLRLLADGYAGLSTRKVAHEAGVPLSQVHYHFGSKSGMVLALLEAENRRLLARQTRMYAVDTPLWRRYEQACDFLEDDLESGYVRILQEMIAAAWSQPDLAAEIRKVLRGWYDLLASVRSPRRRSRPSCPPRSWGPRRCSCSASTATRSPSGPASGGSAT